MFFAERLVEAHSHPGTTIGQPPIAFLELWDRVSLVGPHQIAIRTSNPTVCGEILAEIGARHRLVRLALDERQIGFANNTIGVGVRDKETKRNISMGLPIAVDVLGLTRSNLGRLRADERDDIVSRREGGFSVASAFHNDRATFSSVRPCLRAFSQLQSWRRRAWS